MSQTSKILAFAGSTRKGSFNKKLVKVAIEGAKSGGADVTYIDLADYRMPLYDGDEEEANGIPDTALKFRELMLAHDGLLISSPEYNSSISGVLKNTIDWASRPRPNEKPLACFDGKVAVLMAASPGALGGLRGLVTLRSILGNIKVTVLPDQTAVPVANEAFNDDGSLKDAKKAEQIKGLGRTLADTLAKLKA